MTRFVLAGYFIHLSNMWTLRRLVRRRKRPARSKSARAEYEKHKETARTLVHSRIEHFAPLITVAPKRIAIRDQRSRWGSCSTKGNLNFNYRLVHVPLELVDYVIVHELCHLLEFNHSERFWAHVERILPDYTLRKQALTELTKAMYQRSLPVASSKTPFSVHYEYAH
jgi:predicted metal-dependent hydrolase